MADEQIITSIVAKSDFSNLIADVQKLTSSLSKLQQEFAGSNRALAGQISATNAMFKESMLKTGQFSSHFVSLTSDVEKFGKNLDSGRLKLKDYFRVYQENVKTSGGLVRDLAKQQVQLQNAILQPLGKNAQGLMQYNVHIPRGLDLTKNKSALLRQELQIMNKVIQDGGVQLINWGKNTQWAGRQLTVGLTLPLVAFGKAAADAFKVADQELTRLTKVYGDIAGTSAVELSKVRQEVSATAKELSASMGVNFAETISLAADIAATGKTGNELLSSVSETTRLAVLGEVDRQEAMKATLAIQSAFKQNTEELSNSINFLNAVENQTSTSLSDLVEAIPKAGPVIKGLGGSVQDLALYLTAMREGGINASEGANALKSALASLINPTDVAVGKFKSFGIDLLGIVKDNAGNVTETLFALQAALDKLNPLQKQQAIEQLFGKFQFSRLNALFENLGRQGSQTLQVLDLMKASTSELAVVADRELSAVTQSASGKFKRAVETLKADMAGVGSQFLDVATKLITMLNKVLDFAQKLPDPIKKVLAFGGAFTAIIGPVIMLTGVLANFFGYIVKGLGHFKALFKGAEGFKLLTPEIIAAQHAGSLLSDEFYSDAIAADTLRLAIKKLSEDLIGLQANATSAKTAASGLGQVIVTTAGTPVAQMGGQRVVDVNNPLLGPKSRAAAHLNPRDPKNPATLFGLTLQPIPVNRRIGANPQILMGEELPKIEGLTSIGGVSTGVVAEEHAKYAALMATLGLQSKQEIQSLKKTIRMGGEVSKDFIDTFDDILPITQTLSRNAATQSAAIVSELRAGKMSVEQARAAIISVNAQLERDLGIAVTQYGAGVGRTIDLTKTPLIDQPIVDATGKPNARGMFRKGIFAKVMSALGKATKTKTLGGAYSIETTRLPKYADGGTVVPGPRSETTDTQYMELNAGDFVLNRRASDNLLGFNQGGKVPAMVTPGEIIVHNPTEEEVGMLSAYNNKFAVGGRVIPKKINYGIPDPAAIAPSLYNQILAIESRYAGAEKQLGPDASGRSGWGREFRFRYIMNSASALMGLNIPGMTVDEAIRMAEKDVDEVLNKSFRQELNFGKGDIDRKLMKKEAERVAKDRDKKLKSRYGRSLLRTAAGGPQVLSTSNINPKSIQLLNNLSKLDPDAAARVYGSLFPSGTSIGALSQINKYESEHISPKASYGYSASGNYLQAIAGEVDLNRASSTLSSRKLQINAVPASSRQASSFISQQERARSGIPLERAGGSGAAYKSFLRQFMRGTYRRPTFSFVGGLATGGLVGGKKAAQKFALGGLVGSGKNNYGRLGKAGAAFKQGYGSRMNPEESLDDQRSMGGMGTSFATGLGLQIGGGFVGGSAGQAMQIAGTAMQFLPMLSGIGKVSKGIMSVTSLMTKFGAIAGRVAIAVGNGLKLLAGPVGWLSIGIGLAIAGYLKLKKAQEEAKRESIALNGVTKKGAQELGIQYTTLTEKLKAVREEQRLAADQARSKFESYSSSGVTGLSLTIKQLRELKDSVKTNMKDTLDTLNKLDSSQVNQWATNLKAQLVSAGKSAQEATNLVYALIESSNKAGQGVSAITDKLFTNIVDKGSAAGYIVKNFAKNIDDLKNIDPEAFASNLDTLISSLDSAVTSLIGTKDASGQTIDEAKAIAIQMENIANSGVKNKELGKEAYETLKKQRPEFAGIIKSTDTIGGMYAKWRLYLQGIQIDLQKISSAQAETLANFTAALDSAGANALAEGGTVTGLENARDLLEKLQDEYAKADKAAKRNDVLATGLSKKQIQAINDRIKAIRQEAAERKKALQDQLDGENTRLELQKLQLEYQEAVTRGDMDAAAKAQLSMEQLSKQFEVKQAIDAIDSKAAKDEAAQQAILDKDAAYKEAIANAAAKAGVTADKIAGQIKTITDLGNALTNVASLRVLAQAPTATEAQKQQFQTAFSNVLQDIATAAKTNPQVLAAYGQYLQRTDTGKKDKQGNVIYEYTKDAKGNYVPLSTNEAGKVTSPTGGYYNMSQGGALTELDKLAKSMVSFAETITGKPGKTLSDIYNILAKGQPKGITISQAQLTGYVNDPNKKYEKDVNYGQLKEKGVLDKEGYLTNEARQLIIDSNNLEEGDQFTYEGVKYVVKIGKGALMQPRAVRAYSGGLIKHYDDGGKVNGPGTATSDSIPAYLSNGEYVINAASVQKLGVPFFDRINGMKNGGLMLRYDVPRYEFGGEVMQAMAYSQASPSSNNAMYNINVTLNGTNLSPDDVAKAISREMKMREAMSGRNRTIGV